MYFRRHGPFLEVQAPAKLNLFLEILSRRADGFHELETVLTAIDIFDTLLLAKGSGGIGFHARWAGGFEARRHAARAAQSRSQFQSRSAFDDLPADRDNLVVRAAERLRAEAGVGAGAAIRLIKRIPSAAGLGGASSDAAATLVGLNQLWQLNYGADRLARIALELGSDVPFFLGQGAAVCRGQGERLEPLRAGGRFHFVLVRPPEGLSTAAVFGECRPAEQPWSVEPLRAAFCRGDAAGVARNLRNRLEEPAGRLSGWIGRLRNLFEQLGCLGHQMSGSGTTYFGLVRSARCARRIVGRLRAAGLEGAFAADAIQLPADAGNAMARL